MKSFSTIARKPFHFLSIKKYMVSVILLACICGFFIPVAFAGDPWYIKPITWILDFLLGLLGGIHDPMDHVFNGGCAPADNYFRGCPDYSVMGMWTEGQFKHVIYRGFMLFSVFAFFMITASIIKSGVLLSLKSLSSTMKLEVNDALIKSIIAIVLLFQFFTLTGALFKANNLIVDLVKRDLTGGIIVKDFNNNVIEGDGLVITNERIVMSDLNTGMSQMESPISEAAVSLVAKGVSIWWEVFYLQRKLMIGLLLVLAPLWICCLFYPNLHSITFTAMKELWSQIIAQALHASLFWFYFHIMDDQMGWFQAVVAMCLFIPISESVRFIFGATSGTGGKLAMIGTLTGAAGLMNMTKAVTSLGKGALNAGGALAGQKSGGSQTGRGASSGGGFGPAQFGQSMLSGSSSAERGGGGINPSVARTNTPFTRRLRAAGEFGAGIGSAALRLGLGFAGSGLGPAGAFIGGEVGAKMGDRAGYSAGAASFVGSKIAAQGAVNGAKKVAAHVKQMPGTYQSAYSALTPRDGDVPTRKIRALGSAMRGQGKQPSSPQDEAHSLALNREQSAERWGAAGEVVMGRGGYEQGDAFARRNVPGRKLSAGRLNDMKQSGVKSVYTVENNNSSVLAYKNPNDNSFVPISNYSRGNSSLQAGQTVVSQYSIEGEGNSVRLAPVKEQVNVKVEGGGSSKPEFAPVSYLYNNGGKSAYNGKTADPHQFIGSGNEQKSQHVDLLRKKFVDKY
ncbi:hypothetical protein [Cohnella phaseoli]|uniref:TrbL/VirB6 plasmid conjugal transfer protein n=1 Tax=Cohnella phaseoli TaxID=456490 RepID=A0A3D9JRF6_9BACL|nr:hypothetical protein [Cohnella phaseoli]RED76026.1 hypothetical protein DFP98_11386 [Cohnella phaseoli]